MRWAEAISREWISTLRALHELQVETIIPGHGDPEHNKSFLQCDLTLFQHVLQDAKVARASGKSLDETKKEFTEAAATYAKDLGSAEADLPEFNSFFLEVSVNRGYHELGNPLGASPIP